MKGKKGDETGFSTLAVIVLVLAAAVVLFIFTIRAIGNVTSNADRTTCRTTVGAQAATLNPMINAIDPDCKTYAVRFYEDKVEINSKKIAVYDKNTQKYIKDFDQLNNDVVNYVLAEELRLCWWQFLEGKKSLWSMSWYVPASDTHCFVCNEVTFDDSVGQPYFSGFYDYLKANTLPNAAATTYYDYIANLRIWDRSRFGENQSGVWERVAAKPSKKSNGAIEINPVFDKSQLYAIIFLRSGQATADVKDDPSGLKETYFAYIAQSSEVSRVCSLLKKGSMT